MNPKNILAFNHGQFGDLFLSMPALDKLSEVYPEANIYININKKYKAIASIFEGQKNIKGVFISDDYENFPNEEDRMAIKVWSFNLIFNPMQGHLEQNWFTKRHQTQEVAHMHGLGSCDAKINLHKWFNSPDFSNYIAFQPYCGWYDQNNPKKLSEKKAQEIVDVIKKMGYNVLQIGGVEEPVLNGAEKLDTSIFESIKNILGCKCLVHTDSFSGWAVSGYNFPQIGLYNQTYYGEGYIKNIQPVNHNSQYLNYWNMEDVEIDQVINCIKNL